MKLYTINCYGLNYGIGFNEEDAIKAYLFSHPELQNVDNIESNLRGTEILNDAEFEAIFSDLVIMNNDNGLTIDMIRVINEYVYQNDIMLCHSDIVDIYEVFENLLDEVSIYASYSMSLEEIIKCKETLKDIEADFYVKNFKVIDKEKYTVIDDKYILTFLGFYELEEGNEVYQVDMEETGFSYVYDAPTGTITEFQNGDEQRTFHSLGDFIDNEVLGHQ